MAKGRWTRTMTFTMTNQKNDTAEFIFMMKDSLQLKFRDKIISYYRKANENDVNKTAQKIAAQSAKRAIEEIK
jgi:homoserine kinase